MSVYADRFWKKSWDQGMADLDPSEYETTYVDMIKPVFEEMPDKTAFGYLGVDVTFGELDRYSNQFANMLVENGFRKGDVVGVNLPNIPEYLIALIGILKICSSCRTRSWMPSQASSEARSVRPRGRGLPGSNRINSMRGS